MKAYSRHSNKQPVRKLKPERDSGHHPQQRAPKRRPRPMLFDSGYPISHGYTTQD